MKEKLAAKRPESLFPKLGFGLGLRTPHYQDVLAGRSTVAWFEALSENYMDDGGRPIHQLKKVRADRPIALHGVSLSVGSADPLDQDYLGRLRHLCEVIEPAIVSDHCCWTSIDGQNLHDLMPLPFTEEAVAHISARVLQVQEKLGRRILLENLSTYVGFKHSEMSEWEFMAEIARRADCGLLLDINNVYVNSVNHGFDPLTYLHALPTERIGQIHLAGHSTNTLENGQTFLIDTHDEPVCDAVWNLYEDTIGRTGPLNTMIEWDANIPEYKQLEAEIDKARSIERRLYEK